ncbi:RNA polymerase sigma factor [Luteimonas sp. BDR2-5]|uniref:RNA polymerase sigma factor n=1 Tax=Proluteimonas luteida TaxID=2878685 RepID=UPI001E62B9C7|nr:RNA polymerase sigma factor [Luteimonas sp. BDR2-5]
MDQGLVRSGKRRTPLAAPACVIWFSEHILPHEPGLRRWLARRCTTPGLDVEDIIQESYALLAARPRVDDIGNPRAYLYQTAHSLILRDIRRSRIVPILAMEDLGPVEFADASAAPEQAIEERDMLENVTRVIEAMPEKTRKAFSLRRIHDVPQREIARRMGISEKAVEKLIARGIRWIARWLATEGGERPARVSKQRTGDRHPDGHTREQPEH